MDAILAVLSKTAIKIASCAVVDRLQVIDFRGRENVFSNYNLVNFMPHYILY